MPATAPPFRVNAVDDEPVVTYENRPEEDVQTRSSSVRTAAARTVSRPSPTGRRAAATANQPLPWVSTPATTIRHVAERAP